MSAQFVLLGTGAAEGVPCYGCSCPNCELAVREPRYRRRRAANFLQVEGDFYLFDCGYDPPNARSGSENRRNKFRTPTV